MARRGGAPHRPRAGGRLRPPHARRPGRRDARRPRDRPRIPDARTRMTDQIWVGRDEAEGIPVPDRKDVPPPPHWRLEAIAATERPRSLAVGRAGPHPAFLPDREPP